MTIKENLEAVKLRIAQACERVGSDPSKVEIVAVSKTMGVGHIREAVEAGIRNIGENRVQEAWLKFQEIGSAVCWHMVGHLQTNKVKIGLQFFDIIQSVDSLHLAEEISRQAEAIGREVEIFVEVNTSGETTKFGVEPENTYNLVAQISHLPRLKITGLMTIGAFLPDPEQVRPCFVTLRQLSEEISRQGIEGVTMKYLSMGMTDDCEVAIEEGSNMVRIGRAIFGE